MALPTSVLWKEGRAACPAGQGAVLLLPRAQHPRVSPTHTQGEEGHFIWYKQTLGMSLSFLQSPFGRDRCTDTRFISLLPHAEGGTVYILLGTLLVIHNMPHVPHTCALRPSAWIFVELSLLPGAQVPWAQCSLSWPLSSDDLMVPPLAMTPGATTVSRGHPRFTHKQVHLWHGALKAGLRSSKGQKVPPDCPPAPPPAALPSEDTLLFLGSDGQEAGFQFCINMHF